MRKTQKWKGRRKADSGQRRNYSQEVQITNKKVKGEPCLKTPGPKGSKRYTSLLNMVLPGPHMAFDLSDPSPEKVK